MASRDWLSSCNNQAEVGIIQDLWVSLETGGYGDSATGGTFPTDSDALEHISLNLSYTQPREDSEARSGRSLATRLSQKIEVSWDSEFYIIPADPTGAGSDEPEQPNIHKFLYATFGSFDDTTAATELKYEFVDCNGVSLRAYELGSHYAQLGTGLVVNQATFTLPGDGMAKAAFEGFGQDVLDAQRGSLSADMTASNDAVLQTGEGKKFDIGAHIDIVNDSTGAVIEANREITAITGDTLTLSGAPITASEDALIVPAVLGATGLLTSDAAMVGLVGSVEFDTLGELDCIVQSAEIQISNNFTPKNNIYGTEKICGFLNDSRREVTLSLELELDQTSYDIYRRSKAFETSNVTLKLKPNNGDAALGRTFTFNMPRVEFDVPEINFPSDGVVVLSFEGRALSTDAQTPNDELTLTVGPV